MLSPRGLHDTPRPSKKALYKSNCPGARRQAIRLAQLLWEHDFGHLEATILGQLEARMKMMSEESKLCSHHRLGVSKALPEGSS